METSMKTSPAAGCEAFFSYLEKTFSISLSDIQEMVADFHAEMAKGLSGDDSSLKMLPAFVDIPKGTETGEFMALDLGGTNLRVLAVKLDGKGTATVLSIKKFPVQEKEMRGTGAALFDFIAECMDSFLSENKMDRTRTYDLAFTFSFPVQQTGIAAGRLIVWTKGYTASGVEGEDVVSLLNEALKRRHISCVNPVALANDTVGTLAAKTYADPACDLGVIMGTGTNACYRERISNIHKWREMYPKGHMIVNMEWGNFDKLRPTCYDKAVDRASVNPGAMHLEKMVSGMYLGEITRRILIDLIRRDLILLNEPEASERFGERDSLKTEDMSLIEGDDTPDLQKAEAFLKNKGMLQPTRHDRAMLKRLCELVSARAAALGAGAICSAITWMDPEIREMHTVGIDGSLFEKYPIFEDRMTGVFKGLHGEKAERVRLVHSRDGSGKGAAIIAAVAASSRRIKAARQ
jgi:hexokinase